MPETLPLKAKTIPLSLQAFKSKIKLVEPMLDHGPTYYGYANEPSAPGVADHVHVSDGRVVTHASVQIGEGDVGKAKRDVSKPPAGPLPFVLITGAIFPGEDSWADDKGRRAALNRWAAQIAKEVGRRYETHSEREAAMAFAQSHRLSIACAFSRRIVRGDVVTALVELYQVQKNALDHHRL